MVRHYSDLSKPTKDVPKFPNSAVGQGVAFRSGSIIAGKRKYRACVMFGRALEAVCRDYLDPKPSTPPAGPPKKKVMLAEGIKMLNDKGIIDERLYDWSQQLHAFRNLAAHPDESSTSISRQDAEGLQSFVFAIIEYVYDLTDRYEEFKARLANQRI
jgi:hypothetical protein